MLLIAEPLNFGRYREGPKCVVPRCPGQALPHFAACGRARCVLSGRGFAGVQAHVARWYVLGSGLSAELLVERWQDPGQVVHLRGAVEHHVGPDRGGHQP